jgi:maltose O-acetyltransferase
MMGRRLKRLRPARLAKRLRGFPDVEDLIDRGLCVGRDVYIGHATALDSGFLWLISIGDDTTLSAGVRILAHDGSTKRHVGYSVIKPVAIGRRVYIGAGAIVLPGVTIGDDAIVGAGSVVTRDVSPATIVAGNPARPIGDTASYIERHQGQLRDGTPTYPFDGWTVAGGITDANKRRMRAELSGGLGYVR